MTRPSAEELLAAWPVANTAAGVARAGDSRPVRWGDAARPHRWASVTKLLTAFTALVAVEEGTLDLDGPAGPPGSTVRHLLAHASGLAFEGNDTRVAPGEQRIYSNRGYELLAETLAGGAGMPFEQYAIDGVLEPLGLTDTHFEGSAAVGLVGPLDDLLRFGSELLEPTLVAEATLREASTVAFPGLAGVLPGVGRFDPLDWGLGFELRDGKEPHWTGTGNSAATFGHFGRSGSFLWVDPVARLACAALGDRDFGPWALDTWPAFSDAVLEEFAAGQT